MWYHSTEIHTKHPFVKHFSASSKHCNGLIRILGIEHRLFVESRYASGESCDWATQMNFPKFSSIVERTLCQQYPQSTLHRMPLINLCNVDPANLSAVFGNTTQLPWDFSADSGFLRHKEVLFGAEKKEKTHFLAACWVWLHLNRVASS